MHIYIYIYTRWLRWSSESGRKQKEIPSEKGDGYRRLIFFLGAKQSTINQDTVSLTDRVNKLYTIINNGSKLIIIEQRSELHK